MLFCLWPVWLWVGKIFAAYNEAVNPGAAELLNKKFMFTFAVTETLGIFALLIAFYLVSPKPVIRTRAICMLFLKNRFFGMMGCSFLPELLLEESMPHAEEQLIKAAVDCPSSILPVGCQIFWLVILCHSVYDFFPNPFYQASATLGNRKAHIDRHVPKPKLFQSQSIVTPNWKLSSALVVECVFRNQVQNRARLSSGGCNGGFRDRYEKEIGDIRKSHSKATDIALQDMNSLVATFGNTDGEKLRAFHADTTKPKLLYAL